MMKTRILAPLLLCSLIGSCSAPSGEYDKAIAEFVQNDKRGRFTDLDFRALETSPVGEVTVGDSLRIITRDFTLDRDGKAARMQEHLDGLQKGLEAEQNGKLRSTYMIGNYGACIALARQRLDSLLRLTPEYPQQYLGRDTSEVLCRIVACRFTIRYSVDAATQTVADTFLLNPSGDKCLRRVRTSRSPQIE